MSTITRARLEEVDVDRLVDDVLALPDHLADALWRVESAQLEPHDAPGGMVVAGMGGSAIGGELAMAALGDRASRPIGVARSYGLPSWATPDTTVLCSSYSGNTEETLAAYEAAGHRGARRLVATTGGQLAEQARADKVPVIPLPAALQPRSAVGYMTVAALEVAGICGAGERLHTEIDVAAESTARLAAEWGPDGAEDGLAHELARALISTVPVIAGAGLTIPIAQRWKTQFNENTKIPAFYNELPELDHNEICGWSGASGLGSFSAIFLDDSDLHPRERQRIELTRGIIASEATSTFRVDSRGETRTERVFSLVLLGDLVSVYVAVLRGVDPTPVDVLERLKAELKRS
ncbi:MAG TPA: bifunctional phosphoglucose/phosphomannose isomerase [Solirubrobacteraceae bacterium]